MIARLILFDDERARAWHPFADTRPVGELRFGGVLLRERVERVVGAPCSAHLCGPALDGWDEPGAPPALAAPDHPIVTGGADAAASGTFLWSSRAVPGGDTLPTGPSPLTLMAEGHVAGWWIPAGSPFPTAAALADPDRAPMGPETAVDATFLDWPWTLVDRNADRLRDDLSRAGRRDGFRLHPGVWLEGDGGLRLGDRCEIGPGVVLDTRDGPIHLGDDVRIEGPARLVGPLQVAAGSTVLGGHIARSSIGPVCKVRGEIADSVLIGFANKAHDGHLGHALVGRWVNLGAGTTNSDLKNNYGAVRVLLDGKDHDTGLAKVGCFLGDHVKTGIGTLLTTGAVVGAGANVFGGAAVSARTVTPFGWAGPDATTIHRLDAFLATARIAMERRDATLTPGVEAVLRRLHERTHGQA